MSILIDKAEWMGSIRQSEAVMVNRVSQVFSEGSCWMNRIHSRVCDVSGQFVWCPLSSKVYISLGSSVFFVKCCTRGTTLRKINLHQRALGCLVHSSAATINPAKAHAMIISPTITDTKEAILHEIWVHWGFKWVERESCNHKKLVKAVRIDKFPLKITCWVSWGEYHRFPDKFFEAWPHKPIMFN